MTDPSEYEGWSHVFREYCRPRKDAPGKRHGDRHDPILAFVDVARAVTVCFSKEFRFHDEGMYQLRQIETHEGWTHELWTCVRFEETARSSEEPALWERDTGDGSPILACIDVEGNVSFHFREKVRVRNTRIYQFLPLEPG
jgi:hypothetical protein